jgi:hypothetical protein
MSQPVRTRVRLRYVPSLARISRINVLTAIRDHDLQGAGEFLASLGFEAPGDELLIERGRRYDARALLAYAYGKATGEPLLPEQVTIAGLQVLTDHGFKVALRSELDRPKAAPAARTRTVRTARPSRAAAPVVPEREIKLCPSCFTELSVTGICGFCD